MERIQKNFQLQQKEKEKEREKRKREWVLRCTADSAAATLSSIPVPVPPPQSSDSSNIGMQMMTKMGWNENSSSMGSVIEVVQREERVGLGCEFAVGAVPAVTIEDTAQSRRAAVWRKAQQRFQALEGDDCK
mmetsp:Transcript_29270/g.40217  ORF Transcript_29270/g.40217 Transcript_29270/m.40217 type:complete len:132 (-) Transcript_29270:65-460(-)